MRSLAFILALAATIASAQVREPAPNIGTARGTVYEDRNRNGRRDNGEPGMAGIYVSNQREVVRTDRNGVWQLPHSEDTIFFVVKPKGWMTPTDEHGRPKFYYVHKPAGSPPELRYKGVTPTGPLPTSIDFALSRQKESDKFRALFFGDTQPRDLREVGYIAQDIVSPILKSSEKFSFGVVLGDVVWDNLSVTEPLVKSVGLIDIPWYYVLGNHDINYDVADDEHSDEHWEAHFGPNYYSFNHGPTHFVVLDDVIWNSAENAKKEGRNGGYYHAGLGKEQLEWLKNDLRTVPDRQLVVLLMHIPMDEMRDKEEVFRLLEQRPYSLSVSAHTHTQEHRFFTARDGWRRPEPHHHIVNVTTCGSWWSGMPDETGVPHTTMRDGAPNGYSVFSFDGNQYSIEFRAARRPHDYQMNIVVPNVIPGDEVRGKEFFVNVFGGSEQSKVEYQFANGPWMTLEKVSTKDPMYVEAFERERELKRPYFTLPGPADSTHLWKGILTLRPEPGVYPLHVRTTDMFGQKYIATRAVRVE